MKQQIRYGIFETNSSSTHAICIPKEKFEIDFPLAAWVDVVQFKFGEFGWEEKFYGDYEEKAIYLYTAMQYVLGLEDSDAFKDACDFIKETLEKYELSCTFETPTFKTGHGAENGYIDHGVNLPNEFITRCVTEENYLMKYLFGNSVIITGNDNGYGFWNLYRLLDSEKCDIYEKGN